MEDQKADDAEGVEQHEQKQQKEKLHSKQFIFYTELFLLSHKHEKTICVNHGDNIIC